MDFNIYIWELREGHKHLVCNRLQVHSQLVIAYQSEWFVSWDTKQFWLRERLERKAEVLTPSDLEEITRL